MKDVTKLIVAAEKEAELYKAAFKKACQEFYNTAGGGFENVKSMETCYLEEVKKRKYYE
jgi:hypothetical protein